MAIFLLFDEGSYELYDLLEIGFMIFEFDQNTSRLADAAQVIIYLLEIGLQQLILFVGSFQLFRTVLAALNLEDLHLVCERGLLVF